MTTLTKEPLGLDSALESDPKLWRSARRAVLPIAAIAIVVGYIVFNPLGRFAEDPVPIAAPRGTATVGPATFSTDFEYEGNIVPTSTGAASVRTVGVTGQGTITSIAVLGAILEPGSVAFSVDERPTVVLQGAVPAWRAMESGDIGQDVLQLEESLVLLGYDSESLLAVDGTYTDYTATLVEVWQEDMGLEITGRVTPETIIFLPSVARVIEVLAESGSPPEPSMLRLATDTRDVQFVVDVADVSSVSVDSIVEVRLPDRTLVPAAVSTQIPIGGGNWEVLASVSAADIGDVPLSAVPVTVSWSASLGDAPLTVPASALIRLDSGSYAVERVVDGTTQLVPVDIGVVSGRTVEIIGPVLQGDTVISP